MIGNVDVEEHEKRKKWVIGCFVVMVCFWACTWYASYVAAIFACLANLYLVFGIIASLRLYPPKRD